MALLQILNRFCEKSGFDPVEQRAIALSIINSAAKEIYEFTDLPGCYREITVKVPADSVIALPYFVGELRNMRGYYTYDRIILQEMTPRYSYQQWETTWNKWRLMNDSPIKLNITNATLPMSFSMANPETESISVTIEGRTVNSTRITETVTFEPGETEVQCVNNFIEVYSLTKTATNTQDITVSGVDSNSLEVDFATIPNDRLQAVYKIVDVSKLPFSGDQGTNTRYVEILYKHPLNTFTNDGDTFPCGEKYDDCIAYKALEFQSADTEDGMNKALAWYRKCEQLMNQIANHTNGSTQKQLTFAPNQYLGMYPRYAFRGGYYRRLGINTP